MIESHLDHYEVLGVSHRAKPDEIRKKFHELARVFHPDRYRAEDKETAQRTFVRINSAYNTLIDPEKRAKYDKKLQAAGGKHEVAMAAGKQAGPIEVTSADQIKQWIAEAQNAHARGRLGPARELCERAIDYDYSEWSAHALLGDIHAERARMDEALQCYRLALLLNPSSSITREKIRRIEQVAAPPPPVTKKAERRLLYLFFARLMGKPQRGREKKMPAAKPKAPETAHYKVPHRTLQ